MGKQKCTAIPSLEQSEEQGKDNIILQRQLEKPKNIQLQPVLHLNELPLLSQQTARLMSKCIHGLSISVECTRAIWCHYSAERRIQVSLGNAATNEKLFILLKRKGVTRK